jgi:hypothetical protein
MKLLSRPANEDTQKGPDKVARGSGRLAMALARIKFGATDRLLSSVVYGSVQSLSRDLGQPRPGLN